MNHLCSFVLLHDLLDDSYGNGLLHVTDGESPERRVLGIRLAAHWLVGFQDHDGGIGGFDGGWVLLKDGP